MADIPMLADAAGLPARRISILLGLVAPTVQTPKRSHRQINGRVVKILTIPTDYQQEPNDRQLSGPQLARSNALTSSSARRQTGANAIRNRHQFDLSNSSIEKPLGKNPMHPRPIALALCRPMCASADRPRRPRNSRADAFPARAIKIVVPFPSGGIGRAPPRIIVRNERYWGQPVGGREPGRRQYRARPHSFAKAGPTAICTVAIDIDADHDLTFNPLALPYVPSTISRCHSDC